MKYCDLLYIDIEPVIRENLTDEIIISIIGATVS